jgi:hypothetical protein
MLKDQVEDLEIWRSQVLIKLKIWRFEIQPKSANSGRISGATDKGIDNTARQLSTPEAR